MSNVALDNNYEETVGGSAGFVGAPQSFPNLTVDEEAAQCKAIAETLRKRYASDPPFALFANNTDHQVFSNDERGDGRDIESLNFRMTAAYSRASLLGPSSLYSWTPHTPSAGFDLYLLRVPVCIYLNAEYMINIYSPTPNLMCCGCFRALALKRTCRRSLYIESNAQCMWRPCLILPSTTC